ncbi:lysine histidine transporter-like 6 isoform X1 [Dioscorea cayenensis subsp. rotundata]|uniref:Lysine histidine transporter-like 6 isoform X1 n=2 Tax=Dioscorea cayennensis subsp. rotundata TaxID=55577 RepID=A0AB40CX02_DIOCR|nr:lysine histidine transporter-like 6 isoform X1 [Dioscorea cayenensis subsp. rotundata]
MVSTSPLPKVTDGSNQANSRRAKWWYATFHNVTAMVGAGVLSLPYAMAHLGWGPGSLALVLSWCITLYTLWLMIQLHECVPGTRFDRYRDLGQYAFGPKLGLWIVVPQQLIVQLGCDIVYMVTGGKCLEKFMEIIFPSLATMHTSYWICFFGAIQFFLSQLPDLNSMSAVSFAAAVMSLSYSTISWVSCLSRGPIDNVTYSYKKSSPEDSMFRVFGALGQVAFAYAGHGVILEIQATIPSSSTKPSKDPMWKGTVVAYFITALCYFPVAMVGYWAFGQDVEDNVLMALKRPGWLIAAANLMVVIHVIGSYQVYAMPVFDSIETILVSKFKLHSGFALRLIARSAYVAFTLFLGVTFPFFGDLLGFFGGFGFTPTSYFLPCIIWLAIKKPKRFSLSWIVNWGCIIIGVCIMLVSTISGLRNIISDSSTFQFYS